MNTEIDSLSQKSHFRLSQNAEDSLIAQRQTEWWNHQRVRPVQPLPEYRRMYLESAGAFLVLPKSTTDILIPTYISIIDGLVPVVNGTQVLRDYNGGQASKFLVRAICLITCKTEQAAPFLRLKDDDPVLEPSVFGRKLYEGLEAAVGAELERDRITHIQILALMHLYNDGLVGVERASAHLSQAIHASWMMSIHYDTPGNPIQSQCNMLWWTLRCFDRLNKFIVGAPFMISDNDIQTARPVASGSYQSQILAVLMNLGDLLAKVEEIYVPLEDQNIGGIDEFPKFSELTKNVRFHELQSAHRSFLEIWYHVAAMLSCRSSSSDSLSYERRLRSADRIEEMMSHGRHANLPPLPIMPYAIAMSLTVEYRALREKKRDFDYSCRNLTIRLEILESLGTRWTTAKVMAKLAKRALKIIKRRRKNKNNRGLGQPDVTGDTRRAVDAHRGAIDICATPSETQNPITQNVNAENLASNIDPYWRPEQCQPSIFSFSNETESPIYEISGSGAQNNIEESYEWPLNDPYFDYGANTFYEFSNFGMANMFRDPAMWSGPQSD